MKKLFILGFVLIACGLNAQNRSIEFIDQDFEAAKAKSKESGKIIFVDAYTTWCGPCKWMSKHMFTNDTIADFFNQNFVNLKMDMEKEGDGIGMAKWYNIRSYPTLIFLDAEGNMLHRSTGASRMVKDYIEMGLMAMNPLERLGTYMTVWASGERGAAFTKTYLDKRKAAYLDNDEVVQEYYSSLSDEEMLSEQAWNVIYNYDRTVDSKGMKNLVEKRQEYETRYGKPKVEERLYENYLSYVYAKVYAKDFSMKDMELAMIECKKKNIPYWQKIILLGDLAHLEKEKKYKDYCEVATEDVGDYFNEDPNALNNFAWNVFEWSKKKSELEVALSWTERALKVEETSYIQDTHANLLYKLGRKEDARKAQQKAIELAQKEGEDTTPYKETLDSFK